jgi:hypothetical protein
VVDNCVTFTIVRFVLQKQSETGRAIAKTRLGEPVDVENDISVGDKIQVGFRLQISGGNRDTEHRGFVLQPMQIVLFKDNVNGSDGSSDGSESEDITEVGELTEDMNKCVLSDTTVDTVNIIEYESDRY